METSEIFAELEKVCFPNDFWTVSSIRSTLMRSDVLYLTEYGYDGKAIGYCIGAAAFGEAELYRICILPRYRRNGIGKRILTDFTAMCPDDTERIFLEVKESNSAAISLYKSCGFLPISKRTDYYGNGENAVIMEMKLK